MRPTTACRATNGWLPHSTQISKFHIASTAMHSTSLLNKSIILFLDTTHFRTQKRMEKANSSAGLVQSSCFRGGFKACHRTSCIVNSTASMADWWAICLLDCLAPGPWSYVYVWALLFHMYRPQIIFCPPHPVFHLQNWWHTLRRTSSDANTVCNVHKSTHMHAIQIDT